MSGCPAVMCSRAEPAVPTDGCLELPGTGRPLGGWGWRCWGGPFPGQDPPAQTPAVPTLLPQGHAQPRVPWGWQWLGGCPWCLCSSSAGPSHWKELKATCGGDKQSPVNIDRRQLQQDGALGDILFEGYDQAPPGKWRLANDGHTGACCGRAPSPALAPWAPSWLGFLS